MTSPDLQMPESARGCGQRLRTARVAAGLDITDVATRLRMPVRVVESLESEDWSRLGAPVYVRGQLRSYGRLLGLATEALHVASGVAPVEPIKLVPRSFVPPMQRLAEQAARRIVYVVITALIAVPVWLATRPHLGEPLAVSAPLDMPAVVRGDAPASGQTRAPTPIVASMTPVATASSRASAPSALSLHVSGDSWVKVMAADGSVLEEALLRAGDERRFAAGDVSGFVIGNAGAAQLRRDGRAVDLAPFLRANVARFAVSSDGSLAPAAP
ncbi:MAG TPA: RodZ domain-containing protein [Luteimonas sp.]|nr:RodZ domain-containing protein [Luteimonas sp.]